MDFYKKYELLEMVRSDHLRVFTGREIATGRVVQVHLFTAGKTPETASVLDRLRQIPPAYHGAVIEVGEHEGTPYAVTVLPQDAGTLEAWLDRVAPRARSDSPPQARVWKLPTSPAQPAAAVRPTAPRDEEFAKLFGSIEPPAPPPALPGEIPTRALPVAPPPPPPPQRPPAPGGPAAPASPQPGDFTRQFQASASPPTPPPPADFRNMIITPERSAAPPVAPPVAPPAPRPTSAGPGEFTRMFEAPAAAGARPSAPAPPAAGKPQQAGEFTRMFQAPSAGAPPTAAPAPAPPVAGKPQQAGEFTRMFQAPSTGAPPSAAPAPAPRPAGAGEFTSFFQSPMTPKPLRETGPGADPFAGRPQPPPPARPLDAPGEFTRMFGKDDIPGRKPPLAPAGPPMPAPMAGGSVTQAFATPAAPPPAPLPGIPPPEMQQSGPSEFTRMFKAPSAPVEAPVALPQAAPAAFAAPPKASKLPLILGLGGLVLVIVLLVLFFVLKK